MMMTILAWIGGLVVTAAVLVGLIYAGAFVSWVWYWRFGKGRQLLP